MLLHAAAALQPLDRRATLQGFAITTTTSLIPLPPATAAATIATALKTVSWSATDGFDSDFPSQINFIEFDEKAYRAMRDDPRRTPKFAKAIRSRLAELQDAVVLDLGTGPFCVLALIAATAGAKKVYAVEANPEAARRAKAFIAKCEDLCGNQPVRRVHDAAALVPSSGEEPTPPCHRAGVASMAWKSTRLFRTNAPVNLISAQARTPMLLVEMWMGWCRCNPV